MDGLLIDSEDIYTLCTNAVLHEYGRPSLPWHIKAQLQGRPGPEASAIFRQWAQLPISHDVFLAKYAALQRQHFPSTQPLPGVVSLLQNLGHASPRVHIALATSSHSVNYQLKTAHLPHVFDCFPAERRVLGDDPRIPPGRGKPAPDIYLLALETINQGLRGEGGEEKQIRPEECLVFEDSVPGVEAGRRAGMRVVWVPHRELLGEFRGREREVLAGLMGGLEMDGIGVGGGGEAGQRIQVDGSSGVDGGAKDVRVAGAPGALDDGWADLLDSLEDFPYHRYGINVDR
ncbi:MAG: hypothetical protein M1816_005503 [Peltula sp. TS41687]|nr:MAG: hypothetical protein M1816_005503 [Peltula sp. TS41687]